MLKKIILKFHNEKQIHRFLNWQIVCISVLKMLNSVKHCTLTESNMCNYVTKLVVVITIHSQQKYVTRPNIVHMKTISKRYKNHEHERDRKQRKQQELWCFLFYRRMCTLFQKIPISCLFLKNVSPSKRVICFILNNLHKFLSNGGGHCILYPV